MEKRKAKARGGPAGPAKEAGVLKGVEIPKGRARALKTVPAGADGGRTVRGPQGVLKPGSRWPGLEALPIRKERAALVLQHLNRIYPDPPIPLYHTNPFTLLCAVALSAHTTDKSVNKVTPTLFAKADRPEAMAALSPEAIFAIIRTVGLAHTKSKALWNLSRQLVERHGGEVPPRFEDLEELSGVGHKTASVVMSQAFAVPAFPVDTHIHRLAARWGLSNGRSVEFTERDLKEVFDRRHWNKLHLQLIYYGREYCPARNHDLSRCPICSALVEAAPPEA